MTKQEAIKAIAIEGLETMLHHDGTIGLENVYCYCSTTPYSDGAQFIVYRNDRPDIRYYKQTADGALNEMVRLIVSQRIPFAETMQACRKKEEP